jgi:hypothetical protein
MQIDRNAELQLFRNAAVDRVAGFLNRNYACDCFDVLCPKSLLMAEQVVDLVLQQSPAVE